MKKNLTAIVAIGKGLSDGGCEVFTNFPGFMSHKLFDTLGGKVTSVNEKIAYEVAWGASLVGKRSVVTFKNVGLNDAADPFLNSMLVGVNAGMVLVVFDDMHVEGSQSRQDSRHYFDFFKGLWFEPYSPQNAYDIAYQSLGLSERFQLPVVIRITNQLIYAEGKYLRKSKQTKSRSFVKNHEQFVIHPVNSKYQRNSLAKKNKKIISYINKLYEEEIANLGDAEKLILSFGCNSSEEKKYSKKGYSKLQLFTYPIPNKVKKLMNNAKNLVVLEQGNKFAYEKIEALAFTKKSVSNNGTIPDKSSNYIITDNYKKLFSAIEKVKSLFIIGDLGEYTQDTLDSIDACLCFGSSISVGMGSILAGEKNVISIIGDAAYLHSGKNAIPEAINRKIPLRVIVICNGGSQGTGGQEIPGDLYDQPKEVKVFKRNYGNTSKFEFEKLIKLMCKSSNPNVLYLEMNT